MFLFFWGKESETLNASSSAFDLTGGWKNSFNTSFCQSHEVFEKFYEKQMSKKDKIIDELHVNITG